MKIHVILLAAGNSRRFGSNKLLSLVEGKPMYSHLTEKIEKIAESLPIGEKVLVTQYEEIFWKHVKRHDGRLLEMMHQRKAFPGQSDSESKAF